MKRLFERRFPERDRLVFRDAVKILKNSGYITVIKKEEKYYISNIKDTVLALADHGYIPYDPF